MGRKKKVSIQKNTKNAIITAILPVVCVIIGIVIGHLLKPSATLVDQKIQLKKEMAKKQYFHLKKMRMFGNLGSQITRIVFLKRYYAEHENGTKTLYAEDTAGITFILPMIMDDSSKYVEWSQLRDEIMEAKDEIDPDIYKIFEEILSLAQEHSLEFGRKSILHTSMSPWINEKILGRWLVLNEILVQTVNDALSLQE